MAHTRPPEPPVHEFYGCHDAGATVSSSAVGMCAPNVSSLDYLIDELALLLQKRKKRAIVQYSDIKKTLLQPQGEVDINSEDDELDDSWLDEDPLVVPSGADLAIGSPLVNLESSIITAVFSEQRSSSDPSTSCDVHVAGPVEGGSSLGFSDISWEI